MTAYGIDFGTTNSVIARSSGRTTRVLTPDAGALDAAWMGFPYFDRLVPSVFGLTGVGESQRELFGWTAKLRSDERIEVIKRFLKDEEQTFPLGERSWTTTQVATALFRVLRQGVEAEGGELRDAVVTVPANSPGRARLNTRIAAGNAGINIAALLNEPTAAAMAYAEKDPGVGRVLVYDFGGGTLDVTVLEIHDGVFRERASKGIGRLGGVDLDRQLEELVLRQLGREQTWTAGQWRQFALECERAKIRLSYDEIVAVLTPDGADAVEIHRSDFEAVIEPSVEYSLDPVRRCLTDLSLDPEELDAVLLVGGTSQIPLVRRKLEELLGRPVAGVDQSDPMTAVASGAAVAAAILAGERDDLHFRVVTEHALGTVSKNLETGVKKFSPIIQRNKLLPAKAMRTYRPFHDMAEEIVFTVMEGDPDLPVGDAANVQLGQFSFTLPNPRPRDDAAFEIEYRYDVSGVVHVQARDSATKELLIQNDVSFLDEETSRRRSQEDILEVDDMFGSNSPFLTPGARPPGSVPLPSDVFGSLRPATDFPQQPTAPVLEQLEPDHAAERLVLVVDGSNLACEGRAVSSRNEHPSLEQLLGAVDALKETYPHAFVHVIVDASFRHAIAASEVPALEQAREEKRLTFTPAGTEGKGDALVCAAAEKLGATVVSNDSFKELHDRHPWLFDGRVLGAANVGGAWVFEPRTPVRAKRGLFGRRRDGPAVGEAQVREVVEEALNAGSGQTG